MLSATAVDQIDLLVGSSGRVPGGHLITVHTVLRPTNAGHRAGCPYQLAVPWLRQEAR